MSRTKRIIPARRWNCGLLTALVVAAVNYEPDGATVFDWAAYGGAVPFSTSEALGEAYVARAGDKLTREDAQYFFPELPAKRWRR